jgi:beta-glucosidase
LNTSPRTVLSTLIPVRGLNSAGAKDLLGRLTLEGKISLLAGNDDTPHDNMDTVPNRRLGIPSLHMADGPNGVRWWKATNFQTAVSLAATWDTTLIDELGRAIGREALARGRNVLLGPCLNIHRVPLGGRNFESFSEDPFLPPRWPWLM